jgi:hypothetical protein
VFPIESDGRDLQVVVDGYYDGDASGCAAFP